MDGDRRSEKVNTFSICSHAVKVKGQPPQPKKTKKTNQLDSHLILVLGILFSSQVEGSRLDSQSGLSSCVLSSLFCFFQILPIIKNRYIQVNSNASALDHGADEGVSPQAPSMAAHRS